MLIIIIVWYSENSGGSGTRSTPLRESQPLTFDCVYGLYEEYCFLTEGVLLIFLNSRVEKFPTWAED